MRHRTHIVPTLPAIALALTACSASPTQRAVEPELPEPSADGRYHVRMPEAKPGEERFIAALGTKLEVTCDFQPHFLTGATVPLPQDAERVQALAKCLNQPSLRERDVLLVGHADPRGDATDNHALGLERARSVKRLLLQHGVAADRLRITSAGEWHAKGWSPEYSYGYDRRVDVIIGQARANPYGPRAER